MEFEAQQETKLNADAPRTEQSAAKRESDRARGKAVGVVGGVVGGAPVAEAITVTRSAPTAPPQ